MSNISGFTITDIESIGLVDEGIRVVKKNIPDKIEVSHRKFKAFLRNKNLTSSLNTVIGNITYFDEWRNAVAMHWFDYGENIYYINPKLYDIGQRQHKRIEDEYAQVEEPRVAMVLDDVKSCKIR